MSSIRKRIWESGGKKRIAFQISVTISGKRIQKQFPKKSEAEECLKQLLASQPVSSRRKEDVTFSDIADEWLFTCESVGRDGRPPVERSTLESYKGHVNNHLSTIVGAETKIVDIDLMFCRKVRDELTRNNSRATAKKILSSFSAILNEAVSNECIDNNPAALVNIRLDRREKHRATVPTKSEAKAILDACRCRAAAKGRHQYSHRRYYTMFTLGFFTGLRMSELRGLSWNSITNNYTSLAVEQRADNYCVLGNPKSHAAYRTIKLGRELSVILLEWWSVSPPKDHLALVFPSSTGKPMSYHNIYNRGWKPALKAAAVERHLTPHGMRHFHASHLIELGRTAKAIQVEMGHEDIQTTFNTYGHLFPDSANTADPDELFRDLL